MIRPTATGITLNEHPTVFFVQSKLKKRTNIFIIYCLLFNFCLDPDPIQLPVIPDSGNFSDPTGSGFLTLKMHIFLFYFILNKSNKYTGIFYWPFKGNIKILPPSPLQKILSLQH